MLRRLVAVLTVCLSMAIAGVAPAANLRSIVDGARRGAPYVAGRVVVSYADSTSSAERHSLADRLGLGRLLGTITGTGARVFAVSGDPAAVAARLSRSPDVVYAEPDYILGATEIPNDPRFGELYGIHNTGQSGGVADADIDGPEGWDSAGGIAGSRGVTVGIVDTGIDRSHPDLPSQLVACAATSPSLLGLIGGSSTPSESRGCSDDNDHGSHVAGTIAARTNNGIGVAGVSPNSPLAICKALHGPFGTGSTAGVANCITYLVNKGARVISLSLGGGASTTLQNAVVDATKQGALLIAAAGNDGNSAANYPAAYPQVISVAALDRHDQRASFSNTGSTIELSAAGVDVLSTTRGGYTVLSGTSMATPHVAGVAAVVSGETGLTGTALRNRLTSTADDITRYGAGRDTSTGFGRVNLNRALGG